MLLLLLGAHCTQAPCNEAAEQEARAEAAEVCLRLCATWYVQGTTDGMECEQYTGPGHVQFSWGESKNANYCNQPVPFNAQEMCASPDTFPNAYDYAYVRAWNQSECSDEYEGPEQSGMPHLDSEWFPCGADGWPEEPPLLSDTGI